MSETATYLLNRQKEIEQEISLLQAELARVKIAQVAISRLEPSEQNADGVNRAKPEFTIGMYKSIKELVMEVLEQAPRGLKALDILEAINTAYPHVDLVRTSLSPQLSRLKRERKIVKRGLYWIHLKHTEGLIKQEAPI